MFNPVKILLTLSIFSLIAVSPSCGQKEDQAPPAGPLWKPTGNEGSIAGTISFNGAVPPPGKIEMSQDPVCEKMGESYLDDLLASNGKLQNVFVHIKSGLPKAAFETPSTEASLDQKGCQFAPRVLGLQTGQVLKITNSDPTGHNIHPTPKINKEWNQSQMAGQGPITRRFTKAEVLIPVKCNIHPWMMAWLGVLEHPFFAVSGADGSFVIRGLPPGEYEVEAWHEKFGAKTIKVRVSEKAETRVEFSFDSATVYRAGSLRRQPAIVLP